VESGGLRFSFARTMGTCGGFALDGVEESLATVLVLAEDGDFAGTVVLLADFAGGGGSLP
jgi:hypothetical protein